MVNLKENIKLKADQEERQQQRNEATLMKVETLAIATTETTTEKEEKKPQQEAQKKAIKEINFDNAKNERGNGNGKNNGGGGNNKNQAINANIKRNNNNNTQLKKTNNNNNNNNKNLNSNSKISKNSQRSTKLNNNNNNNKNSNQTKIKTNINNNQTINTNAADNQKIVKATKSTENSLQQSTLENSLEKLNIYYAGEFSTAALGATCAKCSKATTAAVAAAAATSANTTDSSVVASTLQNSDNVTTYAIIEPFAAFHSLNAKQYRKSKSYVGSSRHHSGASINSENSNKTNYNNSKNSNNNNNRQRHQYYRRSYSDRRNSFDRNFAERNKDFVPIVPPTKPVLSSSNVAAVICDHEKFVIIERLGKGRVTYPIMQCGTLDAPDSSYHQQRSNRMDVYQIDDGFHSDGGTETPPPSPSSGSSIASTSDHGSLESVDTGGTQRLAVLSFDQVRKLHNVMDEKVAIHGRGNFPTLEVTLKDLVNLVRRKLEADVAAGGAGVTVKDIRLNGGAASHVLAPEDQSYNDLDLIYAIELSSSRHFDRVKTAVLNTLLDLLPDGVSKRRIMPSALKEAYVGKMVKVNNNNDGDRWSLISLGNSPGHKNVELKFVDTMRRQFEFSVDSFQIVLDSLLLFYDCATLPISENFYPTVVGESVYGDFQEALYHLQKKLISTRQPEEIRGGGLLKYCNLLVHQYKPVDPQRIKTLERYMCSRFFIDFPDINTQTVKLEAYLRNHFWGIEEEPMQYEYLMHLREVVGNSTVCLMGHERRQTLQLIESLATQVLYKEHQKQNPHLHQQQQEQQQHHQQQQQHHHHQQQQQQYQHELQHQQQPQTVTFVTTSTHQHHHHQHQHQHQQQAQLVTQTATLQPQTIYVHQAVPQTNATTTTATICCTLPATTVAATAATTDAQQAQTTQQQQQQTLAVPSAAATATTTATVPQTIQIQAGPPGLIYANGVYYAPVIPTTICTCNSTWLST